MRPARERGTALVLAACLFASGAHAQGPEAVPAAPPAPRYAAIHSLALKVKDLPKARAGVEKALAEAGASDTVAPENRVGSDKVGYAQWSYAVPAKALKALLKRLRRLGKVTRDLNQPELPVEGAPPPAQLVLLNIAVDGPPLPGKK